MGAASFVQLLSREPAPGICVCFGCTLRAEMVVIQRPRRKEGRERREVLRVSKRDNVPRPRGAGALGLPSRRAAARVGDRGTWTLGDPP